MKDDEYGFKARFKKMTVEELITAFNQDQNSGGAVRARLAFQLALREAFLATGLDCSDFIHAGGISLKFPIKRAGERIVQVK